MYWERFNRLCREKGISPSFAAREMGISLGAVSEWKNGRTPYNFTLKKVADYFGVSTAYLIGEEEAVPQKSESEELEEYLEELKNRSEMKMLFSLAKGATKQEVEQAVAIIEALRKTRENG